MKNAYIALVAGLFVVSANVYAAQTAPVQTQNATQEQSKNDQTTRDAQSNAAVKAPVKAPAKK